MHRWLDVLMARLRGRRIDAELDAELESFLAEAVEHKMAAGMPHDEAVRAARLELGSAAAVRDWVRDVGWEASAASIWQDVRYAFRGFVRSPVFAISTALTLTVGIGANLAVFSILDATLLKPLPFAEPKRLVEILDVLRPGTASESIHSGLRRARFEQWKQQTHIFESVEGERSPRPMRLLGVEDPVRVARVTAGLFPMLGVAPARGRPFTAEDEFAADVLLISDGLWQRAFGATDDIVGRTLTLNGQPVTIVGVMPPETRVPVGTIPDAWLPLTSATDPNDPTSGIVGVVARLRPGLSLEAARQQAQETASAMQQASPSREPWTAQLESIDPRTWHAGGQAIVLVAAGAVLFVLLAACTNIASLLLARTSSRRRELAIRTAIGASRGRIARQLFVEASLLAVAGGGLAVLVAYLVIRSLPTLLPPGLIAFSVHHPSLDARVIAGALAAVALTAVLTGLLPALRGSRPGGGLLIAHAVTAPPHDVRLRSALLTLQVTFACVLMVGAGLMTSSLIRMIASDPGYRLDGLSQVSVSLPTPADPPSHAVWGRLAEEARTISGVSAASIGTPPPLEGAGALTVEDQQAEADARASASLLYADEAYFATLGIPLVEGRPFSRDDRAGTPPVAIVDRETAARFWPGQTALGKRIRYSPYVPWMTVVGVAADVKTSRAAEARSSFELYMPIAQAGSVTRATILVRATGGQPLVRIRASIEARHRGARITSAGPVSDLYGPGLRNPRFAALTMSVLGGIALLTAVIGLYGMLAYNVSQRSPELGIRLALGATRADVQRMVLVDAARPLAAGIVLGIGMALAVSESIASMLYQVTPRDPATFAAVSGGVVLVGLAAAFIPARRAAQLDPLTVLRID